MVDCTGFIEPLDLQCWLVNTFAGTMDTFIFISMIVIAGIGAYFRMINATLLIMFALFAIVMANFAQGYLFLVVLVIGLIVSLAIGRIVKR
ncbi:unnamed protein product [marine sediment metagenome]|uniref:Uncharacterized protein n=1 Tax=marine sediment metagenome TaxID=412755 RepID=X0VHS3_9ZZZZ